MVFIKTVRLSKLSMFPYLFWLDVHLHLVLFTRRIKNNFKTHRTPLNIEYRNVRFDLSWMVHVVSLTATIRIIWMLYFSWRKTAEQKGYYDMSNPYTIARSNTFKFSSSSTSIPAPLAALKSHTAYIYLQQPNARGMTNTQTPNLT